MEKKRILSGMRPSGRLHLGNYAGALENWLKLQEEYDCYFFVADWHALTTNPAAAFSVEENTIQMIIDWLSAGIKPDLPLFIQSKVKEHAELHLIFSMLITKERLERNPTLKEQVRDLHAETILYGHLGYPVLQAADILMYKAHLVPVGEDQLPHVEITREIARKFNQTYAEVFPEPAPKLTTFSRLPGLDGRKMGKSNNNFILLSDSPEEIQKKVRTAVTDPQKVRKNDPGHPEICNVFKYHQKFNPEEVDEIEKDCKSGVLGCVACKQNCAAKIADYFAPLREKRVYYENHLDEVRDVLSEGTRKARAVAEKTMEEVHKAMKMG
ncbi:tryptophanyl-tRNA synthetase [Caldithrix abyssi DSM 13497]|uniref:Tryptophan--tRNA ligase n=1 Tax=Caldithrix abyssi DSM 13497 TaxID=880073 RepID=H1XYC2_CALAY|nr:tryptophan--tRNA ligase [Caldithrix abyssi]APF19283.1 tryptophanyl-tRNA synthetase [Caldithrix abyssi DSM 13497]EHO43189.1 tryptophanyl-tRNA synthetase [Caldithrix abyssi DSM 13497]